MKPSMPSFPDLPARSPRFIAAFIVTALFFALGQFHRSSGSVLSSVFLEEFAVQPEQIGFVVGTLFIAQALGQIPAGVLIDRFGSRKTLTGMGLLAALGCLLVAEATNLTMLLLGRALIGFGFSAGLIGSFKLFAGWVEPDRLATLNGRYMSFGLLGGLLATTPLIMMLDRLGLRGVFMFFAVATALMAGVIAVVVRDKAPALKDMPADPAETLLEVIRGIRVLLLRRALWPLLMAAPLLYAPIQILVGLWVVPYLADVHGLSALQRSYCLVSMVGGMSLGPLAYGYLDRRCQDRWQVIRRGALLVTIAFLALVLAGHVHWLLATALATLACGASMFFVLLLTHVQQMFRSSHAGRVVSTFGVIAVTGIFITQTVSSVIMGFFPAPDMTASALGYRVLFGFMVLTSFTVYLLCLWFRRSIEPQQHCSPR